MNAIVLGLFFLACGWKLYKDWKFTRYLALKNAGHPQYFGGALCGAFIFVVCLCLDQFGRKFGFYREVMAEVVSTFPSVAEKQSAPATARLAQMALWAIPAVSAITWLLNRPLHRGISLLTAVARKTRIIDELEEVLYYCLDTDLFVCITMKSKKVYIGKPKRHSPDADRDRVWFAMWPFASGYRDDEGRLEITTYYPDVYQLIEGTHGRNSRDDYQMVIPVGEISTAQSFDMVGYNKFSAENERRSKPTGATSKSVTSSGSTVIADLSKPMIGPAPQADLPEAKSVNTKIVEFDHDQSAKVSQAILGPRDIHHLRVYFFYVLSGFLGIVFLPYTVLGSLAFFAVANLAAWEAIKPLTLRYQERKELRASPPSGFAGNLSLMANPSIRSALIAVSMVLGTFLLTALLSHILPQHCWLPRVGVLLVGLAVFAQGYLWANPEKFVAKRPDGLTRKQAIVHIIYVGSVFGTLLWAFGDLLPDVLWISQAACSVG